MVWTPWRESGSTPQPLGDDLRRVRWWRPSGVACFDMWREAEPVVGDRRIPAMMSTRFQRIPKSTV